LRALSDGSWPFAHLPLGSADRYLGDYAVCTIVFVNFYCAGFMQLIVLDKFSGLIRTIASYTFTLYLVHTPLVDLWLFFHAGRGSMADVVTLSLIILIVTVAVGLVTEHRRRALNRWLAWLYDVLGHAGDSLGVIFKIQK
jgi:hypothetical protein